MHNTSSKAVQTSLQSPSLDMLMRLHPGATRIPLAAAAAACHCAVQTLRQKLVVGECPFPTVKDGGRRYVRLTDLARHLDGDAARLAGPRLGTSSKAERLAAKAAGLTVKQLRAQEGGAR